MPHSNKLLETTRTFACGFHETACGKRTAELVDYCFVHQLWTAGPCHECSKCKACSQARRAFRQAIEHALTKDE